MSTFFKIFQFLDHFFKLQIQDCSTDDLHTCYDEKCFVVRNTAKHLKIEDGINSRRFMKSINICIFRFKIKIV